MVVAMGGRPFGNLPEGVTGISIDSRTITSGEAFFAIKGDRVDGHDYASIAIANGASLLVVSEAKLPALGRLTIPMIVVEDVLVGLQKLGMAARDRTPATVIAVTGSVGKTTTKEMLRLTLEPSGKVHASVASFNNHWGVPLTLARMPIDTRYGVFELGMNHPGEIGPLSRMVRPDVAIITTIAPAHLGNFASVDEIADAKAEIFEGVVNGGDAILNRDNPYYERLEQAALAQGIENIHSFGQHAKAEFRLAEFDGAAELSTVWVSFGGETREVTIGAPGRHLAENAMAVLAAVSLVGADVDAAIEALGSLTAVKGARCAAQAQDARRCSDADRRELQCQPRVHARGDFRARLGPAAGLRPADRCSRRHAGDGGICAQRACRTRRALARGRHRTCLACGSGNGGAA
jgi:UDP-N-acetylmuramoyl-tripeptide--D-alanyl-D-alanine ligase